MIIRLLALALPLTDLANENQALRRLLSALGRDSEASVNVSMTPKLPLRASARRAMPRVRTVKSL